MARFHTNNHCNFSTLTSLPFPRIGIWWPPLLLLLLGFMLPTGIGVAAQSGEGYCTNRTSKRVSYTTTFAYSESVKTTKGCGWFDWSRCTTYREVYRTRLVNKYRIAYRRENICCDGWMSETKDPRLVCIRIPDPTTAVPVNVTDINIPTELPVNYSGPIVTSLHTAVTIATIDDTTDPKTLPGGTVSDAGPGGFFTGEKGKWKLIGLILIVVVMVLVIIVLTAIFVCYRKRRKRESKLANPAPELELLNRGVPSNNGRVGESPYAEIPDGQTEESQLMTNSTRDLNEASTNGPTGTRGANQYHEIADVLQAESTDLPPVPSTEAHMPVESRGGYAYAYVDSKALSRRGDGETGNENTGNVELKADSPNAEYAEVHKNKPSQHPKSPGSSNNGDEEVNVTSENEEIPTDIQAYVTHISIDQGPIENQQNCISETDQEKRTVIHDNPEPYGEVEFGKGIPQNNEYDNFHRAGSKTEYTDSSDVPKPYGELGPTSSPNPESSGYDKIKRSNSRQDSMDTCEEPLTSGYGVVLNDALSEKPPASHTYDTLGNQNPGNVNSDRNHGDMYDRLDRQISTTSKQNGSPTMTDPEKLQKDSRTYSKLKRSTSRKDASNTPSLQGYGVLGDERHGNIPTQVYDKLDSGNQLSAKVPVQDFNDYGHMKAGNHGEVPSNTYNSLKNCNPPVNPPEGAYATIPNDMSSSVPSETYDKLQRGGNDTVGTSHADDSNRIQYDTIGPRNGASSVYNTPGASRPAPGVHPPSSRQDTLYENTPKGKQESSNGNDPHIVGRGHGNPAVPSSGTYNTPHNAVTRKDSSRSTSSNYDSPPSRRSVTRQDSLGKALPTNVAYDTPLSRNSVTREDTIYENTARRQSEAQSPEQYEKMAKGARISNVSAGSYYEDMKGNRSSAGSRGSRASLDSSVPSQFSAGPLTKQDSLYENTPRDVSF